MCHICVFPLGKSTLIYEEERRSEDAQHAGDRRKGGGGQAFTRKKLAVVKFMSTTKGRL